MTYILDEQGRELLRPNTTAGVLMGRGTGSAGFLEQITLASGLYMSGTTLYSIGGSSGGASISTTSGKIVGRSSGTGTPVDVTIGSGIEWAGDAIYSLAASGSSVNLTSGTIAGRSSGTGSPVAVNLSSGLAWNGDAIAVTAVSGFIGNSGKVQGRSSGTGTPINVNIGSGLGWAGDDLYATNPPLSVTSGTVAGRSSGVGSPVSVTLSSGLGWDGDSIYATNSPTTLNSGKVAGRSSGTGSPVNVALSSGLYWDGDAIAVNAISGLQATSGKVQGRSSGTGTPVNVALSSGLAWDGDAIYSTVAGGSVTLIGNSGKVQGRSSGTGTPINVNIGSGLGWAGDDLYATNPPLSVTSGTVAGRSSGVGSPVSVTLSSGLGWDGDSIYATNSPTTLNSGKVAGRSSGTGSPVNVALSSGLYWDGDAIAVNAISGLQATSGKVQGRSSGTGTPVNVALSSGLAWDGDAIYSTVAGGSVTLNSGTIAGRSSGTGGSVGVTLSSGLAWNGDSIYQTYRDVRFHVGGRLTVVSGSPVIAGSGFSGATEIHWQPFFDNQISLYDVNSGWQIISVPTATLALGTLLSGKPYDVFGVLSGGGLYLEANVWSGDALRKDPIGYQDGVSVKSGDPTRRLLGTFWTTTTTTTEDTIRNRYVANVYNNVSLRLFTCPNYVNNNANTTYSFVGSGAFYRVNADTADTISFISPLDGGLVSLGVCWFANDPASSVLVFGPSLDSTSSPLVVNGGGTVSATNQYGSMVATGFLSAGRHFSCLLAFGGNNNAGTIFADFARLGAVADNPTTFIGGSIFA